MAKYTGDTVQIWELFVHQDAQGRFGVRLRPPPANAGGPVWLLRVTGTVEPTLPAEPFSYRDFLLWQVQLLDQGYNVAPMVRR